MNDLTMDANQFSDLLQRYRLGTCTEEEKKWVEGWYNERRNKIYNPLTEDAEMLAGERIYRNINDMLTAETIKKPIPVWRRTRVWWAAAGTMFLMATGGYFMFSNKRSVPQIVETPKPGTKPVTPGGNKALLTLADGSVIVLDSAANGALSQQGKTIVLKKQDGELVYTSGNNGNQDAVAWNTISTPRGGQYQVNLPDGTKVWLNAVSSLRFPAGFTGNERVVELTGEAYFEVASVPMAGGGKKMPFKVLINPSAAAGERTQVEVFGTQFNIKAYTDEASINTTLVEGAVTMVSSKLRAFMKPGQQARVAKDGQMIVDEHADVEEAVAWKNGRFQFANADVETVMREIARWYDVTIAYAGKVPAEKFEGEIPRNSNIDEVIKILELSNVHCKIEGRKITVLP
ncbi:FecR family protein [Longitalea arenae]|uniref:FecR family protein n=1 Tax=Longitalea arenae TaxID=2812558 RepID=UPI0019677FD8|nr:FecR family protein [Longitalea arenae]